MAGAIRMVSLARGHDPRDFALFAFGGAGPLHAAALAQELAIPKLLIPARPGLTNALGCVVADLRHDFVATVNESLEALADGRVAEVFAAQIASGADLLARENVATERVETLHRADMQFQGQSHILPVAIGSTAIRIDELRAASPPPTGSASASSCPRSGRCWCNLHTAVIGKRRPCPLPAIAASKPQATLEEASGRPGRSGSTTPATHADLRRASTCRPRALRGPAIVEQLDCTTVIEPGNRVEVDPIGNLIVSV
jgi:N-methylhydantoinase A